MANYTPVTDFSAKDALITGDPNKIAKGTDIDGELDAIATAVATKADDDAVVHDTGTETVAGNKTFTGATSFTGTTTMSGTQTMSGKSVIYANASIAAHATTMDPWSLGNYVTCTGGAVTFTNMAAAPQAGAEVELYMNAAHVFTDGAVFEVDGNADYTATIGDRVRLRAKSTSVFTVQPIKSDATAKIVQIVSFNTGDVATGTTVLPLDNTIPQNTEGDEYMTLAITPKSATNKLRIDVVFFFANSGNQGSIALFQDSTAGALAAIATDISTANASANLSLSHIMTSGTTSSTTFKIRGGPSAAATMTFNGSGGARRFGGVASSSIIITEYIP